MSDAEKKHRGSSMSRNRVSEKANGSEALSTLPAKKAHAQTNKQARIPRELAEKPKKKGKDSGRALKPAKTDRSDRETEPMSRSDASEIGRKIGLAQAAGELLRLIQEDRIQRDDLWRLVDQLNAMGAGYTGPSREKRRKGAAPFTNEPHSDEIVLDEDDLLGDDEEGYMDREGRLKVGYLSATDHEESKACLFLDYKPVEPLSRLELLLSGGRWIPGTIEWTGDPNARPSFHIILGGDWEPKGLGFDAIPKMATAPVPKVSFTLPEPAVLRWPE